MRTYNKTYRRHRQIFLGWNATFYADGQRWSWKLGTQYPYKVDAEMAIVKRFPTATKISMYKIMCEE